MMVNKFCNALAPELRRWASKRDVNSFGDLAAALETLLLVGYFVCVIAGELEALGESRKK